MALLIPIKKSSRVGVACHSLVIALFERIVFHNSCVVLAQLLSETRTVRPFVIAIKSASSSSLILFGTEFFGDVERRILYCLCGILYICCYVFDACE